MAYKVLRSRDSYGDLEFIFDHLVESYAALGDSLESALDRAADRILQIEGSLASIAKAPFQGTLRPEILAELRNVTKENTIIYFTVSEEFEEIRILAFFFGGQDHQRHMLKRMAQESKNS